MGLWDLGLLSLFREVAKQAEAVLYDDDAVRAELTEIYMMLEAGSLSEDEFNRREAKLVERLEEIEEHKREKA